MATKLPNTLGVNCLNKIEFVGRLPLKTLKGTSFSYSAAFLPAFLNYAITCSAVFPDINACVCAKKLDINNV